MCKHETIHNILLTDDETELVYSDKLLSSKEFVVIWCAVCEYPLACFYI